MTHPDSSRSQSPPPATTLPFASFTGYSEPIFEIIWTILLLALLPTPAQWVGAVLIIAGVLLV